MSNFSLTTVGISGSYPGPGSSASCYVVTARDGDTTTNIVLDLGSGSLGPLQKVLAHTQIDAVFLSHLHPDHCLDVTGLYVMRTYDPEFFFDDEPLPKLPIYGPAGTEARLEAAHFTPAGLAGEDTSEDTDEEADGDLRSAFDFIDLTPGSRHTIGPLTVESHLVEHPVETYALRIEHADGGVMTYSGDSDACDGLVNAARGADLFVCEAAFEEGRDTVRGIHLTGKRAGATASAAGAKRLMLTHIPAWTSTDTVRTEATESFGRVPEVAEPLTTYPIVSPSDNT